MKIIKTILYVLLLLIGIFLIVPLFLPSSFHIERSVTIEKSTSLTFMTAIDYNQRVKWDPWLEQDPDAKIKVEVTPQAVESWYTWDGEIIGKGKLTIKEIIPNQEIRSVIEFIEPQSMTSDVIWFFKDLEGGTEITWAFEGTLSYPVEKWFGLFMDKSLGTSFEQGLSNFKELVESKVENIGRTDLIEIVQTDAKLLLCLYAEIPMDQMESKMGELFGMLMGYTQQNNIQISGYPLTIYYAWGEDGTTNFDAGVPIQAKPSVADPYKIVELPTQKAVKAIHFGHYNTVEISYNAINEYLSANNLEATGTPWEEYITDPMLESDPNNWETHIYQPVK